MTSRGGYISPMRRYGSIEQATHVLTLLGYEPAYRDGRLISGVWASNRNRPARVTTEVRGPFPHRVIVRATTKGAA